MTMNGGHHKSVASQVSDYTELTHRQFLHALEDIQNQWSASQFDGTYADAKEHSSSFAAYKQTVKRGWVIEKQDLATLFGNVQTKLRTYRLKEYIPPPNLSLTVSPSAFF